MGMVLGRRAHHRRAADVDILDHRVAIGAAHHRAEERIEIDDDEIDRRDAMLLHRGDMLGIVADAEQAAVDLRVKRLHPAVHHLGEAGEVGDVAHRSAGLAQLGGSSAGRDDLDAVPRQARRKLIESALVGKRNQRPSDGDKVGHRFSS